MAEAKTTTDHKKIQQWVEKRGGKPACVRGTGGKGDTGLLRIDFPGYSGADTLQAIEWNEFFEKFEEQNLAFLYQETTAGGDPSNFTKFVERGSTGGGRGVSRGGKKKAAKGSAGGGGRGPAAQKSAKKGTKSARTAKTAKSAARKKSAKGAAASGGRKTAKKTAKKAPKKSGGIKKSGGAKKAAKAAGRKKSARR